MAVYQELKAEDLKLLQKLLLAMLLEVDRVCKENDIQYFLAGGTLLGAIRHKGFIPWDDDADIMMLREDYEKFQRIAGKKLNKNLTLQLPNYNPYTRVRLNGTVFASEFMARFPDIHSGIFLDIFCHDRTAASAVGQSLHRAKTKLTRSIVFNKWGNTDIQGDGSHAMIRWLVSRVMKVIPMSVAIAARDKTLVWYRKKNTGMLYDGMGQNMGRGAFKEAWLFEAIRTDFEGYSLPVPKEYDKYLTWLYGDYRKLPPVEQQRASHTAVQLDFGKYEGMAGIPADRILL